MIETKPCSRREALGAALLGWVALSTPQPESAPLQDLVPTLHSRTVVFVRHAEKDTEDKVDPELTERGRARAAKLAGMFAAAGVTATHATGYRRTRQTLEPLAGKVGAKVETYDAADSVAFAAGLGAASETAAGGTVVVAGHSNTVPQMVKALGGELTGLTAKGWLGDDEYDRVVVVTLCGLKGQRMRAVGTVDLRLEI